MNLSLTIGSRTLSWTKAKPAPLPKQFRKRGFDASIVDRLTADWFTSQTSADSELAPGIRKLIDRSRDLERNNDIVERFLLLLENNVLGSDGVRLQMKVKNPDGSLDRATNKIISDAWEDWKQRKYCTMSGLQCFRDVEAMVLRSTAKDGGILIRKIMGAPNPYRFSLQVLEIDYLDFDYSRVEQNGNEVRFGVEFDQWRKPIAFHILTAHPGDIFQMTPSARRIRIPADEIIHSYWMTRPGQTVGMPWFVCVMRKLRDLGKYEEAELVAARIGACKGGFIKQETPDGYTGPTDSQGNQIEEMAPGQIEWLDPGQEFQPNDPKHPNDAYGDFVKSSLRGIAGGLGVNYNSLANDLESVNYSSMRAGKLEEIEEYKVIQSWLIETLHQSVFESWLESSLTFGALATPRGAKLSLTRFDQFNQPDWKPRRWPWVDPEKDINAAIRAIEKGLKSRRSVIAEMGGDIEEVFLEQEEDNTLAGEHHLEFPLDKPAPVQPTAPPAD